MLALSARRSVPSRASCRSRLLDRVGVGIADRLDAFDAPRGGR
jgi:hypothetical protein